MKIFYGWVMVGAAMVIMCVGYGAMFSLGIFLQFWGDRAGEIKDPFGYSWMIATHEKELTKEEIRKAPRPFSRRR